MNDAKLGRGENILSYRHKMILVFVCCENVFDLGKKLDLHCIGLFLGGCGLIIFSAKMNVSSIASSINKFMIVCNVVANKNTMFQVFALWYCTL